ncbi:hypothetical protein [Actinomadura monticuli]|uniref:Uncharacterized protein n=1 Tax=Actinomadura monticuli TaxID=3097367 RepID=A0ABV4QM10_9ACTN
MPTSNRRGPSGRSSWPASPGTIDPGPAAEVLTTELVSACFDHPIAIGRNRGRWAATAGHG